MNKVLISVSSFGDCGDGPMTLLKESGFEIIRNPYGRRMNQDEIAALGKGCSGILAGLEKLSGEVLERLPGLKVISRVGAGTENVDLEAARRLGVVVRNTPDAPTQAVAELTIGLIFDLLRRISFEHMLLKCGAWKRVTGNLFRGKTLGIIGLGRIGKRVAELADVFGVKILACDIKNDTEWLRRNKNVRMSSLEALLEDSDIVTLHISGDRCIIGRREFGLMKKRAFLINIARGGVVDEDALGDALKNGIVAGAALDVFRSEPYGGALKDMDNIILTPHIGSFTRESRIDMEMQAVSNLITALAAEKGRL